MDITKWGEIVLAPPTQVMCYLAADVPINGVPEGISTAVFGVLDALGGRPQVSVVPYACPDDIVVQLLVDLLEQFNACIMVSSLDFFLEELVHIRVAVAAPIVAIRFFVGWNFGAEEVGSM